MIKRYGWYEMEQHPDGPWVKFEDHEKVEQEKEGYKALMGKALDDLKHERISRNKFCYEASQLAADKRELVEALEMLVKNPYQNDVGKWVAAQEKATALLAKHKEGV